MTAPSGKFELQVCRRGRVRRNEWKVNGTREDARQLRFRGYTPQRSVGEPYPLALRRPSRRKSKNRFLPAQGSLMLHYLRRHHSQRERRCPPPKVLERYPADHAAPRENVLRKRDFEIDIAHHRPRAHP